MLLNEGIRVLEVGSCFLCGEAGRRLYVGLRDALFGVPGVWGYLRCVTCGLAWLHPRPASDALPSLYGVYCTHELKSAEITGLRRVVWEAILANRLGYVSLAQTSLKRVLGQVLSRCGPIREVVELSVMGIEGPPNGRLLDVGCGSGKFLARARELGWDVVGVEPDPRAARVAREERGLSVHETVLTEVQLPDQAFAAITVNHVIEHTEDPIRVLRECRRLLKPGGRVVVVTPNVESVGHRLFQEAWRGLDLPRHMYLFSSCALRACAEAAGLRVVKLWTSARSARTVWPLSRLIRQRVPAEGAAIPRRTRWIDAEGLVFQMAEHLLCKLTNAGEELVMISTTK